MRNIVALGIEDGFSFFKEQYDKGHRVVSYALSGAPARHSFVFRTGKKEAPQQRMSSRPREGGTGPGSFYESMMEQVAEGYYPAYVGAFGDPEPTSDQHRNCRFGAVYEKLAPGATLGPYMIDPVVWSFGGSGAKDFVNALADGEAAGYYARCVGVIGVPKEADFNLSVSNKRDSGLRFFATMWPKPRLGLGWAVQLTPNLVNHLPGQPRSRSPYPWRERWETSAMSLQAYPVAGAVTRWVPSEYGPLSLTLTLWHDVRYKEWPRDDPFKLDDEFGAERSFEVIFADDQHVEQKVVDESNRFDRRPISVGATKEGSRTTFVLPLGRSGSESPLPRVALVSDPRNALVGTVPSLGNGEPASGSSGNVADGKVRVSSELERWILSRMKRSGARHAQMVVVRRGALVHASAHTWAEPGYPICTLNHGMRLASVSKSLTAMMILGRVAPQLLKGLDTRIIRPDLLDAVGANPAPFLRLVTLRHLITMNSGFKTSGAGAFFSRNALLTEVLGEARSTWQDAFDVVPPGTYSKFFSKHGSDDYFEAPPGTDCDFRYSGENFQLLGEIVARNRLGFPEDYEEECINFLGEVGVLHGGRSPLMEQGWPAARTSGESPCQVRAPGVVWNRFNSQSSIWMCPSAYGPDGPHYAGAGGWCIPLTWFAAILRALCPQAPRPYLDRTQVDQMATLADPGCGSDQAHGCYRHPDRQPGPNSFTFRPDGLLPRRTIGVVRIGHNGGIEGCSSLWGHQFPLLKSPVLEMDTLSFALSFNQDESPGMDMFTADEIFDILQREENNQSQTPEDLFDAIP